MTQPLTTADLAAALAREFATAVGAGLGAEVTVAASAAAPSGRGWATAVTASGLVSGTLTASIDDAGGRAIAARMMGLEDDPDDAVVVGMLREFWTQAATAAARADRLDGVTLLVGVPAASATEASAAAWVLEANHQPLATLAVGGDLSVSSAAPAAGEAGGVDDGSAVTARGNLAALLDIDLPLVVRFARTELSLRALTMLGPGSMVDMARSPDDPVQLLVGSQVIAEGEVVVVGGNYGVRITSLVSPAERLKAMEL